LKKREKTTRLVCIAILSTAVALTTSTTASPAAAAPGAQGSPQAQRRRPDPENHLLPSLDEQEESTPGEAGEQIGRQYAPVELRATDFRPADVRTDRRVDVRLENVARLYADSGEAAAALYAGRRGIDWSGGAVRVRIDAGLPIPGMRVRDASSRAIVDEVLADLAAVGARALNVVGPHIEAWVPVAALDGLELRPSVRAIRRVWKMRADTTTEGRAVIGADHWDGIKFRSPTDGLQVGIIDLGFMGYEDLQGRELPPENRIITRSFREDGDIDADDEHGAAVAEIIHDIEPETTMYFAAVETIGDIDEAVRYLLENGVDVINMSLGCVGCAPGDGRGAAVEVVERAPQAGVPFVTSAGNEANKHWMGPFIDADNDGWHDFAPGDESNSFDGTQGDEVIVTMNWDFADWFASSEDYDLLLLDSSMNVVDASRNPQAGLPGQEAMEEIVITLPSTDTFHIVVQDIQTTRPQTVELFLDQNGLQYQVPEQSLTVPADGRQVVSVGATFWGNDLPEGFSSRGPTKDGRRKPDMAAPDGVSTASFGPLNFFGTSAAAPHVVGAVALLRGRLGVLNGADTFRVLIPRLVDISPQGPDNITGGGRLSVIVAGG